MSPGTPPSTIRDVLVLGGGSAGLLAALTIKKQLPRVRVRIVYSKEIGIIGVGEGSLPDLPNHLHGLLGIDPADFHRCAKSRRTNWAFVFCGARARRSTTPSVEGLQGVCKGSPGPRAFTIGKTSAWSMSRPR